MSGIYTAIDRAGSISDVLNALVEQLAREFSRTAVFVVKGDRLQGWQSLGFGGSPADIKRLEFPLTRNSPLTRAASTAQTIIMGNPPNGHGAAKGESVPRLTVAIPILLGKSVVGVAYGDDGPRSSEKATPSEPMPDVRDAERLVAHAARRLGLLTAGRVLRPLEDTR